MNNHGGKREGAGAPRKEKIKKMVSIKLDIKTIKWLRDQPEGITRTIEKGLSILKSKIENHQ